MLFLHSSREDPCCSYIHHIKTPAVFKFMTWRPVLFLHSSCRDPCCRDPTIAHFIVCIYNHNWTLLDSGGGGGGIAQWLERRTRDWKVAGSNPCWNGGRIFFSRVDFLCWLLFRYPFHPRVTTVARKNPGHSAKSAGGRLQLNTHTPYVCGFYWTVLRHWSQLVPNMSIDIWGH